MSNTRVYSEYPVIVQYVGSSKNFSSMDGGTSPSQILAFQKWTNKFKFKEKKLAEDGKWGPKTSAAWNQFGTEYTNAGAKVADIISSANESVSKTSAPETAAPKEKTSIFDSISNLFTKASDAKSKAQNIAGQAKDLSGKFKSTKSGGGSPSGDFNTETGSSDEPKSNKKKIFIIGGIAVAVVVIGYFALRSKTSKTAKA